MAQPRVKTRPIGAIATLQKGSRPQVTSRTNGTIGVVTGASDEGFNPLDLIFASLASCLCISARIAAANLGWLDQFVSATADVTGTKADDEPSRLANFTVDVRIEGALTAEQKQRIVEMAEEICTVSNTLRLPPAITVKGS